MKHVSFFNFFYFAPSPYQNCEIFLKIFHQLTQNFTWSKMSNCEQIHLILQEIWPILIFLRLKDWFDFEPEARCVPPCLLVTSDWWGVARLLVPAPGSRRLLVDPPLDPPPPSYNSSLTHNTLTPGSAGGGNQGCHPHFMEKVCQRRVWAPWTKICRRDLSGEPNLCILHYLKGTNETFISSTGCISWQ